VVAAVFRPAEGECQCTVSPHFIHYELSRFILLSQRLDEEEINANELQAISTGKLECVPAATLLKLCTPLCRAFRNRDTSLGFFKQQEGFLIVSGFDLGTHKADVL